MKPHVRLFVRGTLYALVELMFLVIAAFCKTQDMPQPYGIPVYMYLAFLGATIAAFTSYRIFMNAIVARHKALQL